MSSEKGPKYIYAQESKLYYYYIIITLEGIEEINTEKMTTKHSEEYFSHQRCEKTSANLKWFLDFDWLLRSYEYLILIFYWFISAG